MDITNLWWKEISDNVITNLNLAMIDVVLSSIVEKTRRRVDTLSSNYEFKSLHTRIFVNRKLYTL